MRLCVFYDSSKMGRTAADIAARRSRQIEWIICKECQRKMSRGERLFIAGANKYLPRTKDGEHYTVSPDYRGFEELPEHRSSALPTKPGKQSQEFQSEPRDRCMRCGMTYRAHEDLDCRACAEFVPEKT